MSKGIGKSCIKERRLIERGSQRRITGERKIDTKIELMAVAELLLSQIPEFEG